VIDPRTTSARDAQAGDGARRDGGSRLGLLRDLSDQTVLQVIFRHGPITRPEIAAAASLSKPTVSAAITRLEQEGLVRADGARSGQRGRSPITYVVSDRAGCVVGCDVGGTTIRVAAADLFGEPIADLSASTPKDSSRAVARRLAEMIAETIGTAEAVAGPVLALGLSVPGVVDQATGRVTSLAYNVAPEGSFDPVATIRERFDLPVLVDNDVNMAALGERWFGLARGVSTMVFIAVGAGIGMGMMIDDDLIRGAHGAAGEIGYLPLVADPFSPDHRLHGGLEDEVAAAGIVAAYERRRGAEDQPAASAEDVFARAEDGDLAARQVVDDVAARLGMTIAIVCAVMDPALVVLGGGIGSNPMLLSSVRGVAASLLPITARVEATALGDRAALQGALAGALRAARDRLLAPGPLTGPARGAA
jgi:predicted NBD/HSP70 family sugar kinase